MERAARQERSCAETHQVDAICVDTLARNDKTTATATNHKF